MGRTTGNAVKIYQITYTFGFALSSILFLTVNKLFPLKNLGTDESFNGVELVEDVAPPLEDSENPTKEPFDSEKQLAGDAKV